MGSMTLGDKALCQVIDDMRLGPHPAKKWELEFKHGSIRAIMAYMSPSKELVKEAMAELDALRREKPAKPYESRQVW